MEMHWEWGTREERGWGDEEDGRRVGDTGCDEAVDLICSPAPSSSFPASVTCVLSCLLHFLFAFSLLFVSPHFIFVFLEHSATATFWIFWTPLARIYTFFLSLLTILSILLTLLFLFSGFHSLSRHFYSLYICLGFSCRHAFHFIRT